MRCRNVEYGSGCLRRNVILETKNFLETIERFDEMITRSRERLSDKEKRKLSRS